MFLLEKSRVLRLRFIADKTGQELYANLRRRMRRYGVFIPERFAYKGLTGQFLPQLWNRME